MAKRPQDILAAQAYHRSEWGKATVERYEKEQGGIPGDLAERVALLYRWFLSPFTLWPCNVHELLNQVLDRLKTQDHLDRDMILLLDLLPAPPGPTALSTVVAHEHDVQAGRYEHLVAASAEKFQMTEKALARNRKFQQDWRKLREGFDTDRYVDHKGIIRRSLVPERNWRSDLALNWRKADIRFQAVFDTFCAKWNLYGMQGGKPLLLKLSVNLTAFGTMIFIPAYWSFDPKRDIRWGAVTKLHKSRGQHRQGKSLGASAEQRQRDAAKLAKLDVLAKKKGLKGAARHEFLCHGLGLDPRTDPKRIARLRKLA